MNLFKTFKNFRDNEDGAVTIDWVVLTAASVGLAIAVVGAIQAGFDSATGNSRTNLRTTDGSIFEVTPGS